MPMSECTSRVECSLAINWNSSAVLLARSCRAAHRLLVTSASAWSFAGLSCPQEEMEDSYDDAAA